MKIFSLSHTETLIDRLLEILAGISRTIRFCVLHDISFYALRSCEDNFKIPIAFTSKKKKSVVSKVFHNFSGLIPKDRMSWGKDRSEPFLSSKAQVERTEIRPGKVKRLSLRNCSFRHFRDFPF